MTLLTRYRLLFLALVCAFVQLIPLAYAELGRDQANWLTVAMALEHGSVMYRDVAVVNTPGLGVIFLAINSLGISPTLTPWVVHCLTVLGTIWAGFVLVCALCGRAAAQGSALLLALLWTSSMGWWDIAQKDALAFAFALGAMAVFAAMPDRKGMNILAGMLLAAAVFTKTSAVVYALPALILLAVLSGTPGRFLIRGFWITLGAIAFLLLPAFYLFWHDAWEAAKLSLVDRASAYGGFKRLSAMEGLGILSISALTYFGPVLVLPLVLWTSSGHFGRGVIVLAALLLTACLGAVLQGRGFPYHAVPVMASLALILGSCLGIVFDHGSRFSKVLVTLLTVVAVASSFGMHQPRLSAYTAGLLGNVPSDFRDRVFSVPDKADPSESRQVADWIAQVTKPDDKIFVWGMESQIYIFADRMFVGPSFADAPIWQPLLLDTQPAYFERQMASFMAALTRTPPKVFVVARNDANPVEPMSSDEALKTAPALSAFVAQKYAEAFSTPHLIVYQLIEG